MTDPAAGREPLARDALPPGSGEIDTPDEDVEQTLEAFRQLSGEDVEPAAPAAGENPEEEYDPSVPQEDGFAMSFGEETPEAQPVVEPAVETPQPPAAEPPVVATPTEPQPTSAPSAQPGVQAPAPAVEYTFDTLAQQLQQNEQLFRDRLAEVEYTISDKDLDELNSNPKQVYARMMARVHVNAVSSVMRTVAQTMPMVVSGMIRAARANEAAANRFWQAFPQLDRNNAQHRQTVSVIARNVRAMNPSMSEADMVRFTGAQAAVMLGMQGAPAAAPQPARRAGPPQMPGRQVRQTQPAYSPAAARAAPGSPVVPQRNQWDLMTSLIQMGDSGRFDPAS